MVEFLLTFFFQKLWVRFVTCVKVVIIFVLHMKNLCASKVVMPSDGVFLQWVKLINYKFLWLSLVLFSRFFAICTLSLAFPFACWWSGTTSYEFSCNSMWIIWNYRIGIIIRCPILQDLVLHTFLYFSLCFELLLML